MLKTLFIIIFLLLAQNVLAMPSAKKIIIGSNAVYKFKNNGVITFPGSVKGIKYAADWLAKKISKKNSSRWHVFERSNYSPDLGNIEIYTISEDSRIPYKNTDKRFGESYIIRVSLDRIKLYVGGSAGALYAAQRLLEMMKDGSLTKSSIIIDYPDYKWRGVYINPKLTICNDPYRLKEKQKKSWLQCMENLIDKWRLLRINSIYIQSPIFYRLTNEDIQLLGNLFNYARRNNIEPVPVLASKLWDIPSGNLKVDAVEGVFHKNVKFRAIAGKLIPVNNDNLSYTWAIKKSLFYTNWKNINSSKNKLKKHISINQEVNTEPWKNPVFIKNSAGEVKLKVQPGQYYELMLSIRTNKNNNARILVTATDYNEKGDILSNIHRYSVKLLARHNWQKRWIPIFTSQKTHKITIQVSAKNISKETAHIEVANPVFLPMNNQLINVLVNNETAPIVKSMDESKQYIRGKDYEIRQASIKEWRQIDYKNIKKTEIKLLPGSNIHNGQLVNIGFDTLPLEYRAIPISKYSAASRYTYKEYQRIFKRLKWLSPKFIHISMDEHKGGLNRDSRSKKLGLCNRDLYISYINTLDNLLHKQGEITLPQGSLIKGVGLADAKLIMWDDMLNPWHNGNNDTYQIPVGGITGTTGLQNTTGCGKNIKLQHDVLLADWWYKGNDKRGVVKNSPAFYRKLGYQYFISTWYQKEGISNWTKSVKPSDTEGFIATTWNNRIQGVSAMACVAWNRSAHSSCLKKLH